MKAFSIAFGLVCLSVTTIVGCVGEDLGINVEDVFEYDVLQTSTHSSTSNNVTKYYCIMRGLWSPQRHPVAFPALARMSNPLMYSANKEMYSSNMYPPWMIDRSPTWGAQKLAETGFTDMFRLDLGSAGTIVYDVAEGDGFSIDQVDSEKNYAFLPSVTVNADYPFLSGISSLQPSPDWFTGFYQLNVINDDDGYYWNRIIISTYPFDAGTDKGTTYTSIDEDQVPPGNVTRIYLENAPPGGIFVSPDGDDVYPVAEWDCELHVCPGEGVDCERDEWPPANGCDILMYPGCEMPCDPQVESCQQCKPKPRDAARGPVYYKNCCWSNYEPVQGSCYPESSLPPTLRDILPFCDLPIGFDEGDPQSLWVAIRACFENYPSCLELTEQGGALLRCFNDAQTDPSINVVDCFDSIVRCVENLPPPRKTDPFADLPSCVIESGLGLTQCFLENVGTCASSCLSMDWTLPLQSLLEDAALLVSCPAIAANVIDPLCQAFSCCEPCVETWEEMSSCLMNDVLGLDCDSGCSAGDDSSRRKLKSNDEDLTALARDDLSTRNLEFHEEVAVALSPQARDLKNYLCNICGCEDCTFADPLGVVNFVYDNKNEKRPCQQLQQEVQNPTIYNTTYCHDVIWRAAFEPCLCYNENVPDVLLSDIPGYADRPYGNPGTMEWDGEDDGGEDDGGEGQDDGDDDEEDKYTPGDCNICGCEDCTFADPLGVVSFIYDNKNEKRPCQQLQQEVWNPTIYNTTYCRDVIWRAAFEPCLCYNENVPDVLLSDIPGYGDRDYGNSGTANGNGDDDDDDEQGAIQIFSVCRESISGGVPGWIQFANCVIQAVLSVYRNRDSHTELGAQTEPPTVTNSSLPESQAPTNSPTVSPTSTPDTTSPTSTPLVSTSAQTFEFSDLAMRLQGGKQLTVESRAAFETATEAFYRNIFLNTNSRRRLQEVKFSSFDVDVTVTGESLDALGNTITYDQSVSFVSMSGSIDESTTRELILKPLEDENQQEEYVQLLQENDPDFASVTDAESKSTPNRSTESEDSGFGLLVIVIAIAGGLVCCCCVGYIFMSGRGGSNKSKDLERGDEPEGDGNYMVPEGPLKFSSGDRFADEGFGGDGFHRKDTNEESGSEDDEEESGSEGEYSGSEDSDGESGGSSFM